MEESIKEMRDAYAIACKDMDSWAEIDKDHSTQYKKSRMVAERCFFKLQQLGEVVEPHLDIRPSAHPDLSDEWSKLSDAEYKRIVSLMDNCPFCGKNDGYIKVVHFHHWVCECGQCDAEGPVRETPQKALEFWNKRAQ